MIRRRCLLAVAVRGVRARSPTSRRARSLTLDVDGASSRGRWDMSLRDLEDAVGLDANGDAAVSWGELAARHDEIVAYALPRLAVRGDDSPAIWPPMPRGVDTHGGAAFAVLELAGRAPARRSELRIDYDLLFEIDRAHRAIVTVAARRARQPPSCRRADRRQARARQTSSAWWSFARFVVEGVRHIWRATITSRSSCLLRAARRARARGAGCRVAPRARRRRNRSHRDGVHGGALADSRARCARLRAGADALGGGGDRGLGAARRAWRTSCRTLAACRRRARVRLRARARLRLRERGGRARPAAMPRCSRRSRVSTSASSSASSPSWPVLMPLLWWPAVECCCAAP